ncbi:hypothetical protein C2S51_020098 [Perilla frutescens var. frutescens]|nr:hypothetical protein C2S51_020098 [Perilla frutescens var. frutescens]
MKGVGVTMRNMAKQALKMTTVEEEEPLFLGINEEMESNLPPQASGSLEVAIMMVNDSTIEDQLANITKLIEGLHKRMQHQDDEISKLKRERGEASRANDENHEENGENNGNKTPEKPEMNDDAKSFGKELNVSVDGSIPINQLKEFIEGTIKDRFGESSKSMAVYSKPYTQRINNLKMLVGYQPPKFQQFDRKGNPRQHVAHFVETCNNAGTYGDHLVKQFVRSLKGNAFDWYTYLEPISIDSWEQLEHEFLNRFYSTRRTVSMVELTSSRRWKEEPVIDYINRWRNLCLNCKDRLSEASAIEMCIQGMHWGLQYILRGIQPRTFEEPATRAHDMELSMAASGIDGPPMQEPRKFKERQNFKRNAKPVEKAPKKESMAMKATPVKFIRKDVDKDTKQNVQPEKRMTLKEMQQKQYHFLDSDVSGIFDDLLKEGLIELPEMKRLNKTGRTDDPKYCKYHRLVGHAIHDCFILKDKIINVVNDEEDDKRVEKETHVADNDCISIITFTDEDLQLGSNPHNMPLFMSGYACEKRINRILVDGGSAVNILPLRTLKELEIPTEDLSGSQLMIQGFNHEGQMALGTIRLDLLMDDMKSTAMFHYYRDGVVKMVVGDHKPFTEAESYFADSKYYLPNTKAGKGASIHQKEPENSQKIKKEVSGIELLEGLTLPLAEINAKKPIPPPLKGFVRPTQGGATEHGENQQNYGLNATQKMLKKNGHAVPSTKAGLRFIPQSLVRITIKRATTNYVFEGEFSPTEGAVGKYKKKDLRTSIFKRLGKTPRVSVFKRLGRKCGGKITQVESSNGFNKSRATQKLKSLIPSRMKRCTTLTVSYGREMKAEMKTVIFTQHIEDEDDRESIASSYYAAIGVIKTNNVAHIVHVRRRDGTMRKSIDFKSPEGMNEKVASSHHITLSEEVTVEEEDAEIAPPQFEEGVKSTVDELKEINLGDENDPRPTYISALLTADEENLYIELLKEFKDVFAWSYKEMPGLNPKIVVHHLAVKKGIRPVKQAQRRFRPDLIPLIEAEYAFGVKSGKFLGFIVHHQGIKIEKAKIDAIMKMSEPRNLHELKSLQGKLAYLRRFISNLAGRCQPFSRIMKNGVPFEWDESCSNAFKSIKGYLMKSPVLVAPMAGRPLILYIAAQERSMGALLVQENENDKESALYYLSRMMTLNELKYSPENPLKYVMSRPVLSNRLARWYLQLQQFEIIYVPQKAVKGQVLADFLANHPIPAEWELTDDLPDEDALAVEISPPWLMYFDGAAHKEGAGAGVVFVTPEGEVLPYSFTLTKNCSNNVAEYQALVLGLKMTVDTKRLHMKVYGDSKLVINQINGEYKVKKPELLPYVEYAQRMIGWLGNVEIEHVPRKENKQADALAKLASIIAMVGGKVLIPVCKSWVIPPVFGDEDGKEDESNVVEVIDVRRRATRFIYFKGTLYRRSFDGVFLRCLSNEEAAQAIEEAHSGICGAHQSGPMTKSSGGHLYILAATDYFSKWAEAIPLREVKKENVADFIKGNIIYRYGIHRKSSIYNAAANGLAEAFNKTLCNLLKKVVGKSKRDWHERIGEALWAYRTTHQTPTQATPYSLVYELEALDEKRLEAQKKLECYQARLSRTFNKKVRPRSFQVGDLVLAMRRPIVTTHRVGNKFIPRWDGPYVVTEMYTNGAYKLISEDRVRVGPINRKFLKRYYP